MKVEELPAIRIQAPEWFERPDFMAWLNDPLSVVATWHTSGTPANDYSDVFTIFDHGEGPDCAGLPDDCWEAIAAACQSARLQYTIIWISPV